jgi:hypothetical protein
MSSDALETTDQRCGICGRPLDQPNDPTSQNCGGDCLRCMAEAGDPDCQRTMAGLSQTTDEIAHAAVRQFAAYAAAGGTDAVKTMMRAGMTEAAAHQKIVLALLDLAAGAACRRRRVLVGGEPDPEKWAAASERAFADAVRRTEGLAKRGTVHAK